MQGQRTAWFRTRHTAQSPWWLVVWMRKSRSAPPPAAIMDAASVNGSSAVTPITPQIHTDRGIFITPTRAV